MKYLYLVVAVLALALVGCAHKTDIVGKWKMDISSMPADKQAAAAGMMKGLSAMLTLEFKKDNTFSGMMMEGTYTVSGNTVTMTATKVLGMDASKMGGNNKPETAELSEDGKTLTIHTPASAANSSMPKGPGSSMGAPGAAGTQRGSTEIKFVKDTGQ